MSRAGALMIGVLPMLVATAAFGQSQAPQVQGTVPAPQVFSDQVPSWIASPPAIGSIGGLPVRVWAPVPPPYDQLADRNGAANPIPMGPE